jgi:hypothetical protein
MSVPESPLVERFRRYRWIRRRNIWLALLALGAGLIVILPFDVLFAAAVMGLQAVFMFFPWEYPRPGRRSLGWSHFAEWRMRDARLQRGRQRSYATR